MRPSTPEQLPWSKPLGPQAPAAVGPASVVSTVDDILGRPGPFSSLDSQGGVKRSLSICSSKGDGQGSIRLGTPVHQERTLGSRDRYPGLLGAHNRNASMPKILPPQGQIRHGYMPPEAGRICRMGGAPQSASGVQGLSRQLVAKIEALFQKMDLDHDGCVTYEEARTFFRRFGRVSADAMFRAVDEDGNEKVTYDEFLAFWAQVKAAGYNEEDLVDELAELLSGQAWVNFHDQEASIGALPTATLRGPSVPRAA